MVEGEQHVVDRRTVGHIGVSHRDRSRRLPSSHETAVLSTLRWAEWPGRPCIWHERKPRRFGRHARSIGKQQPDIKARSGGFDPGRNFAPSRLKWLNSLYRPALPKENRRNSIVPPLSGPLNGASPSGKAVDFDSTIRRFESSRPSQHLALKSSTSGISGIFILNGVN